MASKPFFDTNVVVYAYTLDDARNERATALLGGGGVVSVQVLNEFVDVARRKLRFDWKGIADALEDLGRLLDAPLPLTSELHRHAVEISRVHGFRIYDSLVVSAAKAAGCGVLYTEDLQNGQSIEGVLVRDPFADR